MRVIMESDRIVSFGVEGGRASKEDNVLWLLNFYMSVTVVMPAFLCFSRFMPPGFSYLVKVFFWDFRGYTAPCVIVMVE